MVEVEITSPAARAAPAALARLLAHLRAAWDSWTVGLAVLLFHAFHLAAVARSPAMHKGNIAFDFDVSRFVALWGVSPFPVAANEPYYASRHPLAVLMRLVCRPFVSLGVGAELAACGVAAACAALSAVIAYRIARALGLSRILSALMTALWAFSTASLILGVLPETYDLALVALAAQFLVAVRWTQGREPPLAARIGLAVLNFGITITNVVLSGLTELVCRFARQPPRKALAATLGFTAAVAVAGVGLAAASLHVWPMASGGPASAAVRQVYWDAASAERTGQRQSPAVVSWTLGGVAFVAPRPARYATAVPDNPYLWDLRGHDYDATGWIGVLGWVGLLLIGAGAAVRDQAYRPVWIIAAAWIAANVLLHSYWQFRESLFLYSPHSHIGFFMLALAGARWAQAQRHGAVLYGAAATLVLAAMALNNLPTYLALASLN